jgi:hypothetical protein
MLLVTPVALHPDQQECHYYSCKPWKYLEFTYQPSGPARAMSQLLTESKVSDDLKDKSIDVYPNPPVHIL